MTNILLVDDEKFDREICKSFLQNREGCHLMEAESGFEALDLVSSRHPDLVLMDLHMPDMDGDECCDLIKRDSALKNIPVIIVTASGGTEVRTQCLHAGCDDFITKPVNRRDFLSKINALTGLPIRRHARKPLETETIFICRGEETPGIIRNISEGGVYLTSGSPLDAGNLVQLRFRLETMAISHAVGQVAWTEVLDAEGGMGAGFGMGIKFIDLQEGAREIIAAL